LPDANDDKREQGADLIMKVFPSRVNDFDINNQTKDRVIPFFEMNERNSMDANINGITHILNSMYFGNYTPEIYRRKTNLLVEQKTDNPNTGEK
jgi:hypothetical protein